MERTETVAVFFVAFFIALCFVSGVGGCTYQSKINTLNDTIRMKACVDQGKDWLYVERANTFQCVGNSR